MEEKKEEKTGEASDNLEKKVQELHNENLNKNEIISKKEKKYLGEIFNKLGNGSSQSSDALTFIALFIAMLLGYYLVK